MGALFTTIGGPLLLLEAAVVVPGLAAFLVLLIPFVLLAAVGVVLIGVPIAVWRLVASMLAR
jgi:hypothetical protein